LESKKGQAQDLLIYGIIIFILGIVILISFKLITDINTQIQDNDNMGASAKASVNKFKNNFATIFDAVYVLSVLLFSILMIVSVFLIDTHPIFFALSLPLFLAVLFVNVVLANALDDIGNNSVFATLYDQLNMMQFIASHWIALLSIVGFITLIVFYSKRASG